MNKNSVKVVIMQNKYEIFVSKLITQSILTVKLIDVLLLYPAFALLLIGLHQILLRGFAQSYWILMLALILLYGYQWRRTKQASQQADKAPSQSKSRNTGKSKKK